MVTLANRVKVTSATTGTADTVWLGSAITGFQTFSEAGIADGAQVRYVIEDGANFEIGVGTFQSPAALVRSDAKVSESTSSNNKINLSGNAIVFITASAEDIPQLKVLSTQTLDNPNAEATNASDGFGHAVAVSGNYTVVGVPSEDTSVGGTTYSSAGTAYIFDTVSGSLLYTIPGPVNQGGAQFGATVGVSGKYAIIGSPGLNGIDTSSGGAYIYDVTTGTLVHTIDDPNAYASAYGDLFGASVAISGKYAIASATYEDDSGGSSSGKAYIFDVETGSLLYTLDNPNPMNTSASDLFGNSVSISGNYAIVGAEKEDDFTRYDSGYAYIYDISSFTTSIISTPTYTLSNPNAYLNASSDNFGRSVSISGNYAIVGAPQEDDAGGDNSGKAYIYDISTLTTSTVSSATYVLDNPNVYGTSSSDEYGRKVSISGNYAIVGAPLEDEAGGTESGKVYIYDISTFGSGITPVVSYTISNPNAYDTPASDLFGDSVAISGNHIVVGAAGEDDAIASSAGKAYIFKLNTEAYAYTADEISLLASSSGGSTDYINSASFNTGTGVLSLTGEGNAGASVDLDGRYQLAGTYNTVIGTDSDIDTSGSTIIDNIYVTDGVITSMGTRTLTAGDIGAQPSGTYNTIIGTDTDIDTSGSTIIDNIYVTDGVITSMGTRTLTAGDIGALPSSVSNQNLNTTNSVTFAGVNINGNINDVSNIYLEDAIYHVNDANTYTQFHNEDEWRVVTGGTERLEVNNTNVTVRDDLIVNGGDITLGGTGRIQGVDTVSSDTDAANKLYVDNAVAGAGGGISNVVEDTTPQLGGDLDNNGNNISITNGNLSMQAGANSGVIYASTALLGNSLGTAGYLRIEGDGAGTAGRLTAFGDVTLNDIVYPSADGTNGQFLQTDGAGNLSFADASGGGTELTVMSTKTLDNPNAYDTSAYDNFGAAVAISGNYAIVSTPLEDDAGGFSSGKAYIFDTETGSLLHTLDNPSAYSTSSDDRFGVSVDISGNYAIVGANQEDDAGGNNSGKAYIFNVTDGSLVHTLNNPNAYSTSSGDWFGERVAISGNYAVVGARLEDDAGGTSSGKVYVFNVTDGSLVHTLNNPNAYSTSQSDGFGLSVDLSGNYVIVGAYGEDDAGGLTSGKAYIFDLSSGNLLYTLNNPNAYSTSEGDQFAKSVAIDGNYVIVGAYREDSASGTDSGKAYIYDISTFTTSTISSANYVLDNPNAYSSSGADEFGELVAISGNYAIVSADQEDDAGGTGSGKAYIYDISTFTTTTISSANYVLDNPTAYSTSAGDTFSASVAISGNYAIVGATGEDEAGGLTSGKAYIFRTNGHPYSYSASEIASFAPAGGGGGIADLVEDTTPQLGGTLLTNGNSIHVEGAGTTPAEVRLYEAPNNGSNYVALRANPNTFSTYTMTLPINAGSDGQVLTTNGSDTLYFTNPSSGISNVVEDTTPQLGGNLDLNSKYIGHANAYMKAYDFGTGSIFGVYMQGYLSPALEIYSNPGSSIANVSISSDLTVGGGDISLGGTGRIQGIDTVSADTDAANKLYVDTAVAGAGGGGGFAESYMNNQVFN